MDADEQLVVPHTGELVALGKPDQCVRALAEIRALESQLREAKNELTFYLAQEFQRQGLKTMEFAGVKAELRGGTEIVWNIEVLEDLRHLGLPEERFNALVRAEVSYKVNAREAQRIASSNERYAEVIARAKNVYQKPHYVSVKS